ncbi:hypothetical protein BH11PSE2_BH11PSE2_21420 [soil metagenome]
MQQFQSLAGALVLAAAISSPAAAQAWRVGDAVQYFDSGWWNAVVLEIGSGQHAGYVLVKADGYSTQQWAQAKNVRARPAPPAAPPAAGPRLGDYSIMSYGNPANPLRLGKISLAAGGAYRFYDNGNNLLGQGRYSFAAGKITWLTGILKTQGWTGGFEVAQGGRVHNIRLKPGTIATNPS